jgi:ArsR family metal-binding transcriptional regulator
VPGNPNEIKLVNNAVANATRRKIMNFLANGGKNTEEIAGEVGKAMLDFHLNVLQQASLIELDGSNVKLSEYGKNFLKDKAEKTIEKTTDLSQAKPVEIAEVRQLLPCIADSSKFRVIANIAPPLGGTLKFFEPLFSRGRYSDRVNALITQKGEVITTIYGNGKVVMTMIKSEREAKEALENLRNTINEAIAKGITPTIKEKIKVEPLEIYKYLPQTNCGKCYEQSCYTFAIKLMAGEVTLNMCTPLNESKYATNQEQLQVLTAYI